MSTEPDNTDDLDDRSTEQRLAALEDRVDDLERENKILRSMVDGTQDTVDRVQRVIAGPQAPETGSDYDLVDARKELGDPLVQKLLDVERLSETSLGLARAEAAEKDTNRTKKDCAKTIARNEVVRKAITDSSVAQGASVNSPQVKEMAKPEVQLAPKTIRDAMETLSESWECLEFHEGNGRGRGDPNELRVDTEEITPDLARAVSMDVEELDSQQVMNKVHNRNSRGGV